jgi:hypothetical protein
MLFRCDNQMGVCRVLSDPQFRTHSYHSASSRIHACDLAAGAGQLEVRIIDCQHAKSRSTVVQKGPNPDRSVQVLQWLRGNGCCWGLGIHTLPAYNQDTCHAAARGGHLRVLQWARQNGCAWNAATSHAGLRRQGFKVVFDPLDGIMASADPLRGSLHNLFLGNSYLSSVWIPPSHSNPGAGARSHGAARGGHLELLKWARAHGCAWDSHTSSAAAGGGHLLVLQWLRAGLRTSAGRGVKGVFGPLGGLARLPYGITIQTGVHPPLKLGPCGPQVASQWLPVGLVHLPMRRIWGTPDGAP